MSDPFDDPEWKAYARRAETELHPMIKDSALVTQLFSEDPDAKLAIELGFSILLDKPLVIIKVAGQNVPATLARAADSIFEVDGWDDLQTDETAARFQAEVDRVMAERGISDEG